MARDCREPKRNKGRDAHIYEQGEDEEDISGSDGEVQQEVWGFSVEEVITGQIVSKSDSDKCKINMKLNKNHLL